MIRVYRVLVFNISYRTLQSYSSLYNDYWKVGNHKSKKAGSSIFTLNTWFCLACKVYLIKLCKIHSFNYWRVVSYILRSLFISWTSPQNSELKIRAIPNWQLILYHRCYILNTFLVVHKTLFFKVCTLPTQVQWHGSYELQSICFYPLFFLLILVSAFDWKTHEIFTDLMNKLFMPLSCMMRWHHYVGYEVEAGCLLYIIY